MTNPDQSEPGLRVYFIHDEAAGFIKIGLTADVMRRLSQLQCGNPHVLRLLGDMPGRVEDEKELHARFSEFRFFREWFFASPKLLTYIRANCNEHLPDPVQFLAGNDAWLDIAGTDSEVPF